MTTDDPDGLPLLNPLSLGQLHKLEWLLEMATAILATIQEYYEPKEEV